MFWSKRSAFLIQGNERPVGWIPKIEVEFVLCLVGSYTLCLVRKMSTDRVLCKSLDAPQRLGRHILVGQPVHVGTPRLGACRMGHGHSSLCLQLRLRLRLRMRLQLGKDIFSTAQPQSVQMGIQWRSVVCREVFDNEVQLGLMRLEVEITNAEANVRKGKGKSHGCGHRHR